MKARRLLLAAIALALPGCTGVVTNGNGPAGPERIEWGPPWRVAPPDRASRKADACGTLDTCEGGACRLPKK